MDPNERKFNKPSWFFLKFMIPIGVGHCGYFAKDVAVPLGMVQLPET
jgi:hypothetical protein